MNGPALEPRAGDRIVLRGYTLEDVPAIHAWKNDDATTRWMGRRFRRSFVLEDTVQSVSEVLSDASPRSLFFVIADRADGSYRGGIDLTDIDAIDRNAVLSLVIGEAAYRGRGLGTEAVRRLLAHAFGDRGLHKVSLTVMEANKAALRCYQNLGFREEGRLRDHRYLDGRYHDLITMGLLADEFR